MKKYPLKKYLFPIAFASLLLISLGIFGGFSAFAENIAEKSVESDQEDPQDILLRNYIFSDKTVRAVCKKFDLDYQTVTVEEAFEDRKCLDYATSASLKLDNGDSPLLESSSSQIHDSVASSLESYLNDVYAFDGGRQIIEEACEKYQVSLQSGKIGDFTIEQLMAIERQAFETSPHPH